MDTTADPQLIAKRRERERLMTTYVLAGALVAGILVVAGLKLEYGVKLSSGLAWGFALYATGVFLGFLFGIPRVAANGGGKPAPATDAAQPAEGAPADAAQRKTSVNSNLVEVSDWLTKIIVGVGLVELKRLGEHGESLAVFMAGSFGACDSKACAAAYIPVAGAIALYFGVLGFITGYLLTRVFLAVLMNLADRDADNASLEVQLPAGTRASMAGVVSNLIKDIGDLQTKVVAMPDPTRSLIDAPVAALEPDQARSVLWVDDRPYRNVLTIDRLKRSGVTVYTATSTKEALSFLGRSPIPVVISDMHRDDDSAEQPAGLLLLQALASRVNSVGKDRLRFLVFCSKSSVQRHEAAARSAGANLVTASTTDLVAALEGLFGALEN